MKNAESRKLGRNPEDMAGMTSKNLSSGFSKNNMLKEGP